MLNLWFGSNLQYVSFMFQAHRGFPSVLTCLQMFFHLGTCGAPFPRHPLGGFLLLDSHPTY